MSLPTAGRNYCVGGVGGDGGTAVRNPNDQDRNGGSFLVLFGAAAAAC